MNLIPVISLEKPAMYQPCNGCGMCCIVQVCDLGLELGDDKNCRALLKNDDGSYGCGLIVDPYSVMPEDRVKSWKTIDSLLPGSTPGEDALRKYHADMLGAGKGCDSLDWISRDE